jgi:hypothetical protein
MALPEGFIESLGGDKGSDDKSGSESTDDGSMLEQHLRAMFRAGNAGNFAKAADCFQAAMTEAGSDDEPDPGDAGEGDEPGEY